MPRPTAQELIVYRQKKLLEDCTVAIQGHLDLTARAKGYGDAQTAPSISARSYAGYVNPFQAECILYGQWCASCLALAYQVLAEVQAGTRVPPTPQQLVAMLPAFTWE